MRREQPSAQWPDLTNRAESSHESRCSPPRKVQYRQQTVVTIGGRPNEESVYLSTGLTQVSFILPKWAAGFSSEISVGEKAPEGEIQYSGWKIADQALQRPWLHVSQYMCIHVPD